MDQPDEDDLLRALNDWTAAAGPVQQPWSLYNAKGLMLAEPNLAYQVRGHHMAPLAQGWLLLEGGSATKMRGLLTQYMVDAVGKD